MTKSRSNKSSKDVSQKKAYIKPAIKRYVKIKAQESQVFYSAMDTIMT